MNICQGRSPGIDFVKFFELALAWKFFTIFFQQGFKVFPGESHHILEVLLNNANTLFNGPDLFLLLVDIVAGNSLNFYFQEAFYIFPGNLADKLVNKGE